MNQIVQDIREKYESGKPTAAKDLIAGAVSDKSNNAETLLALAALAAEFSDFESARMAREKLAASSPDNADHHSNYASALIQAGDFDSAEVQLEKALSIDETHPGAYFNLSMIRRVSEADDVVGKLETLLETPNITPSANYAYRLALGKFYDDLGEYDKAFIHISAAKDSAPVKYERGAHAAFFGRLKTAFTQELMNEKSGAGEPSSKPIFIVGMPRSGSSLLEKLLARDKRVTALGERLELTLVLQNLVTRMGAKEGYLELLPQMTADDFKDCGDDYVRRLSPLAGDAEHFIDKNVLNYLRAGFINLALPNAAIIHARRGAIDTCLSCYFQPFDPAIFPFSFKLDSIGHYYALYADLMDHWDAVAPNRIAHVDYESLIADTEKTLSAAFEHIGLSSMHIEDGQDEQGKIIATASAWQARQPIYETSAKRWKNYEKHLAPLFKALEQSGFDYSDS